MPTTMKLAPTLAQRVFQLREYRNLTVKDLAKLARFAPGRIEDIEAGLETWLSTTERQVLAKALAVEPSLLQEVESRAVAPEGEAANAEAKAERLLAKAILEGKQALSCPVCASALKVSVVEGFDLEGREICFPRAFCIKCPFVL